MKKQDNAALTIKTVVLTLSPIFIAWAILFFLIIFSPVSEFIGGENTSWVVTYTDQLFKGSSKASVQQLNDTVIFQYELKKGYSWPYAGICIIPAAGFINRPNYNTVALTLKARNAKVIPISLNEYVPGYTDTIRNTGFRSWNYDLKIIPGKTEYQISLDDFKIPVYWEKENKESSKLPGFDPARIRNICIQNCILIGLNESDEIRISKFSFKRKFTSWIWRIAFFSVCWAIGNIAWWFFRKNKKAVFIPYVATETAEKNPDEWGRIQAYISSHYMEELDMAAIEKQLGIARHKIAFLIKEKTSLLFKQYLNQIRVAEAKRLLQETDLPIGELADKVGFGHISNFNRVFKEYTGLSPSDLRRM